MARIFFFHWNAAEAATLAEALRRIGHDVEVETEDGARGARKIVKALRGDDAAYDAAVLSLSRLPSHSRVTATYLRSTKAAGALPLIFVAGAERKVAKARRAVPDGVFCDWDDLPALLACLGVTQPDQPD